MGAGVGDKQGLGTTANLARGLLAAAAVAVTWGGCTPPFSHCVLLLLTLLCVWHPTFVLAPPAPVCVTCF